MSSGRHYALSKRSQECSRNAQNDCSTAAFGSAAGQTSIQVIQEGAEEGAKQVSSIIESTQRQPKTTPPPTPIPQVLPPIETSPANQTSDIRQRAKENPAVAATLLGGLGSAGLL